MSSLKVLITFKDDLKLKITYLEICICSQILILFNYFVKQLVDKSKFSIYTSFLFNGSLFNTFVNLVKFVVSNVLIFKVQTCQICKKMPCLCVQY